MVGTSDLELVSLLCCTNEDVMLVTTSLWTSDRNWMLLFPSTDVRRGVMWYCPYIGQFGQKLIIAGRKSCLVFSPQLVLSSCRLDLALQVKCGHVLKCSILLQVIWNDVSAWFWWHCWPVMIMSNSALVIVFMSARHALQETHPHP